MVSGNTLSARYACIHHVCTILVWFIVTMCLQGPDHQHACTHTTHVCMWRKCCINIINILSKVLGKWIATALWIAEESQECLGISKQQAITSDQGCCDSHKGADCDKTCGDSKANAQRSCEASGGQHVVQGVADQTGNSIWSNILLFLCKNKMLITRSKMIEK